MIFYFQIFKSIEDTARFLVSLFEIGGTCESLLYEKARKFFHLLYSLRVDCIDILERGEVNDDYDNFINLQLALSD